MIRSNEHYAGLPGAYLFRHGGRQGPRAPGAAPALPVISLGIGDVTRPLPPAVITALHTAVDEMASAASFRGYGPEQGYDFLREAIAAHDYRARGVQMDASDIFVSDGSRCDVANIQELFSLSCRVAVTDPVYPVYVDSNAMAGRAGRWTGDRWSDLIYLPCTEANDFVPDFPAAVPDIIYLCSPTIPPARCCTGMPWPPGWTMPRRHGALIIYDAAYEAFIRDTEGDVPHSIFEIPGAEEVAVECRSFSKTAGFTGLRCAFTTIPAAVTIPGPDGARIRLQDMWEAPPEHQVQRVPLHRAACRRSRLQPGGTGTGPCHHRGLHGQCGPHPFRYRRHGPCLLWRHPCPLHLVRTPDGMGPGSFSTFCCRARPLVCTPGAGFGPSGEGYVRFTAFGSEADTTEALERLQELRLWSAWGGPGGVSGRRPPAVIFSTGRHNARHFPLKHTGARGRHEAPLMRIRPAGVFSSGPFLCRSVKGSAAISHAVRPHPCQRRFPASMLAEFLVTDAVLLHAQGHDTLREPQGLGPHGPMSLCRARASVMQAVPARRGDPEGCPARHGGIRCRLVRGRPERTVRAVQFTRQVLGQDQALRADQEHRPLHDVFQLADVAGPGIALQHVHDGQRDADACAPVGRSIFVRKVGGQRLDVVLPLAQGRHVDGEKRSGGNTGRGGRCPPPPCGTDRLVAVMMRTSTVRLSVPPRRSKQRSCRTRSSLACVRRESSPTSSRKERPAVRQFEPPLAHARSTGEGPFLMAGTIRFR